MHARMTLIGIEKELNRKNKSIIDTWSLDSDVFDADVLLTSIVTTGGTFEPLYTDPEFFYLVCADFWNKYKRTFQKWYDAFEIKYAPLENYDRTEHTEFSPGVKTTITHSGTDTDEHSGTDTTTPSGTTTVTEEFEPQVQSTTETKVSAFDSSSYSPKEQVTTTPSAVSGTDGKDTTTSTTTYTDAKTELEHGETIDTTYGHVIEDEKEGTDETDIRVHGNIGVTSSQQMLEQELKVQAFNIIQHITDIFCAELLLTVY